MNNHKHILWFNEVDKDDVGIVGGKGANLGEMVRAGIPVPYGFIVTAKTYFDFIDETHLRSKIKDLLEHIDVSDARALDRISKSIKELIIKTKIPDPIAQEIMSAYMELAKKSDEHDNKKGILRSIKQTFEQPLVAVRSSATAEDLPTASFAGQQATYLNIKGEAIIADKVKECWASLFEARAIFYRVEQKFDHFKVGIAVPVQKMVQSDASGVMFTVDPLTGTKSVMVIEAIYGLGEYIVQGTVTPDHYEVDKKSTMIKIKTIANQTVKLALTDHGTKEVHISKDGNKQKVTDREILEVAKLGKRLERHYFFPQDIEWAVEKGKVYIVQTRPITTLNTKATTQRPEIDTSKHKVIAEGDPASPGMASGSVQFVLSAKEVYKVKAGDVLVANQTNPDYVPAMRKAVAIVTERGGRTSHAAIVSRELGVPAVVGADNAMKILKEGQIITVDGSSGKVYEGAFASSQPSLPSEPAKHLKTATKVYVNLAEPSRAADIAKRQVDGIGLLRAEFMVANIGVHPKKLIKEKKQQKYIDMLSDQLTVFCKAFNPRPVIYRATDFKTNEYRNLIGGREFEPEESNPMLGYRGAYRYITDPDVFALELEAIKKVRNKHNLKNLMMMIPFVRSPKEFAAVKKIAAAHGLIRSSSFKLWIMVELPVNVILLEDFIKEGIDGVSIGSNDLTMLILGTDRDNSEVASEFDERSPAVAWALERVITTCHKHGITASICGQAPSDYPELVENLVKWGITSVSVNPDAIERVRETIYQVEHKLVSKNK